jgi:xylobiose transport system permease protein
MMDLLRIFDLVYIMTKGAPGTATTTISYLIYRTSFQEFEVGYGAALAVLVYMVVFVLAQVIIKRTGILQEQV